VSDRPSYPVAARALLRDSLLDAAGDLMRERAWGTIPMAEIARGAGVSRQTLYNEFGDRQGIAQAFVLREGDRLLSAAERALAAHPGEPRQALQAAVEAFLSEAAGNPLIAAMARSEGDGGGLLELVTTRGAPVLAFATERVTAFLVDDWPGLPTGDARVLAESMVRLAISHAALPTAAPAKTASDLAHVLGPLLADVYAQAESRRAA